MRLGNGPGSLPSPGKGTCDASIGAFRTWNATITFDLLLIWSALQRVLGGKCNKNRPFDADISSTCINRCQLTIFRSKWTRRLSQRHLRDIRCFPSLETGTALLAIHHSSVGPSCR